MAFEVLLGGLSVYSVSCLHKVDGVVNLVGWDSSLNCDVASMQIHMTALNALYAHGPQSCKILRKTN